MGLFTKNQKKAPGQGKHGPPRPGDDRLKRAQARAVEMALKRHPEMADDIARMSLGLSTIPPADPFATFAEQMRVFRELMPEVEQTQKPAGMIDWAAVAAGVTSVLLGVAKSGAFGGMVPGADGAPADGTAPALGAGQPLEDPVAAPSPPAAASAGGPQPVAERRRSEEVSGPVAWQSRTAIGMLAGRTPAEAAAQLNAIQLFDVPAIVAYLVRVPDDEVIIYLGRLAAKQATLAGFMRWAAADPEWTVEVVRELRRIRGEDAPAAAAS